MVKNTQNTDSIDTNDNNPISEKKIEYTKDCKQTLTYASIISDSKQNKIGADDLFWGCFHVMHKHKHGHIFWKLLGFDSIDALQDVYDNKVVGKQIKQNVKKAALVTSTDNVDAEAAQQLYQEQRTLVQTLENEIVRHVKKGNKKIDLVLLLSIAILYMSHDLRQLINDEVGDVDTILNNIKVFLAKISANKVGLFAFLQEVDKVLENLHLDISQLTTMYVADDDAIKKMLEDLETMEDKNDVDFQKESVVGSVPNNGDIDIMDRDDMIQDANSKTKKKKKKGADEKKLTIEYFGTDLCQEALDDHLDPCIGRDKEIQQVIYTLLRKTKNNPLLIGEAGVGKTAIVEGLAQRIIQGDVPEKIKDKKIYMLDMGSLVAGTKYRGDFETRFKAILEEAADPTNNIILFIDEIHTLMGAGGQAGTDDASQLIKPMLARGKIKLVGATTFDEYQKHLEKDAALKRRFQEIHVNEPTPEVTKQILDGLKKRYEDFHGVQIVDAAIVNAIRLSQRYVLNKFLPDKAIDIIDEAAARKSTMIQKLGNDDEYQKVLQQVNQIDKDMELYVEKQDYYAAAELKKKQEKLKDTMHHLRNNKNIPIHMRPLVEEHDIGQVLADKTGVPSDLVTENEIDKLRRLSATLQQKILGQNEAVKAIVKTLQNNRLSVIERNKPIGSFLFLGPSGVGKTYLAKLIAKEYFGDEKSLIRVDMSEFMEKYSISKLIGSAPGYVGHESGGTLTESIKRQPYSVVLFDEVEKADRDVLNILLQLLDEGHIKDSKGRYVSFKSTIVIMTSNLGHSEFSKKVTTIGFSSSDATLENKKDFEEKKKRVLDQVKEYMSPELLNRIDYKIVFRPLQKPLLQDIFSLKINEFLKIRKEKSSVKLPTFSKKKIAKIIDKIHDPEYGVRPIEKYIHDEVESEIIEELMKAK